MWKSCFFLPAPKNFPRHTNVPNRHFPANPPQLTTLIMTQFFVCFVLILVYRFFAEKLAELESSSDKDLSKLSILVNVSQLALPAGRPASGILPSAAQKYKRNKNCKKKLSFTAGQRKSWRINSMFWSWTPKLSKLNWFVKIAKEIQDQTSHYIIVQFVKFTNVKHVKKQVNYFWYFIYIIIKYSLSFNIDFICRIKLF